jgi:cysteate synthase
MSRSMVEAIDAKVLSNRKPPYSPAGGLYDALTDSKGDVLLASNAQAGNAAALFREKEGIDIHCAAAVATASLIESVQNKTICPEAIIMLNITGGGEQRFKSEHMLHFLEPSLGFPVDPDPEQVKMEIGRLF